MANLSQKQAFELGTGYQFDTEPVSLGPWTSYSLLNDPKHMCFVLSRYKFCAKMLEGKNRILEIGCGDAFGIPIIAQAAQYVLGIDVDDRLINGNRQRLQRLQNVEFQKMNICEEVPDRVFDAVISIDVIEHLDHHLERPFMTNLCKCLKEDGICIVGTPNLSAKAHATPRSAVQHINLKSMKSLRELMERYFQNVFMFGMNDETLHTGYAPMCHYIWSVAAGLKRRT